MDLDVPARNLPVGRVAVAGGDDSTVDRVEVSSHPFDAVAGNVVVGLADEDGGVVQVAALALQVHFQVGAREPVGAGGHDDVPLGVGHPVAPAVAHPVGGYGPVHLGEQHVALGDVLVALRVVGQVVGLDGPGQLGIERGDAQPRCRGLGCRRRRRQEGRGDGDGGQQDGQRPGATDRRRRPPKAGGPVHPRPPRGTPTPSELQRGRGGADAAAPVMARCRATGRIRSRSSALPVKGSGGPRVAASECGTDH